VGLGWGLGIKYGGGYAHTGRVGEHYATPLPQKRPPKVFLTITLKVIK